PWVCEAFNAMTKLSDSGEESVKIFQNIEKRYLNTYGASTPYSFTAIYDTAARLHNPEGIKISLEEYRIVSIKIEDKIKKLS
ncbi:MAG: hypothetical protein V4489_04230, partial [Chlamydiota bacterium]